MEVSFPSADKSFQIFGNLSLPQQTTKNKEEGNAKQEPTKIPAILMIAGSGPIDRNGNVAGWLTGISLNTSNRFAESITSSRQEIAVLSYDKRGVGKSVHPTDKNWYYRAGMMDLVSDAVEALRFLQNHPAIDPASITVLGHSEGAIVLPLISQQLRSTADSTRLSHPLKGAIFLSGFGENLFDAMTFQQENALLAVQEETGIKGWCLRKVVTKERVDKQLNHLMQKINDSDNDYVSMHCGLTKVPAKWFREHKTYNVQATLADEMTCHCLAITGKKDVQVRHEFCLTTAAEQLVPKAASVEAHVPEHLTHVLRSLEGPSNILKVKEDYVRMGKLPLDPELLSIISNWCNRVLLLGMKQ
mmetsp:Transcript_12432/g.20614  ORF Transcript_12432/g.20614 Transcript_12432/m.20614 type:complete len:359 (-) Transcript_12432:106-1182(-)|eukprot:CAMPEP_0119016052 /NCGR_PEP_ID=MMETSP1176-20130426/11789_1 /TAXON_ID=265551 /ORGANISM="Synedropsis recta cf, Strain CCMP1620" /LENGTH=358 /DNA_ID=CAMNT_0006969379 /DNA_START=99 /DNA_END=1175 /DNA_ORIENTATION=+